MSDRQNITSLRGSRAPRGARGLKSVQLLFDEYVIARGRAPRGARGLKYVLRRVYALLDYVVPLAGHVD